MGSCNQNWKIMKSYPIPKKFNGTNKIKEKENVRDSNK